MRKNKSELIKLIENFVTENNEDIIREFDNWRNAFNEANVGKIRLGETYYTDENILNVLKKFYRDYDGKISDGIYKKDGRKPRLHTIYNRFGTWNNALEKAGLPTVKANRRLSEEEIIKTVKEAYIDIGNSFTTTKYDEWAKLKGKTRLVTVLKRYGNWKRVLEVINE